MPSPVGGRNTSPSRVSSSRTSRSVSCSFVMRRGYPSSARVEDSDMDPLIEAILAAPDDDAPRRVWADRLLDAGEPWGELVHVQCDLAAGGLSREAAIARRRRERALIDSHGERWGGALAGFA